MQQEDSIVLVKKTIVAQEQRSAVFAQHFGIGVIAVESAVYNVMDQMCPAYKGGYWEFVELSNGGFYLFPVMQAEKVHVIVASNSYTGEMSPEAAGLFASAMAFSHLSFHFHEKGNERMSDCMGDHFHHLRDYICEHLEGQEILAALD